MMSFSKTLILSYLLVMLHSCRSWDSIYNRQQEMFIQNKAVFEKSLNIIKASKYQTNTTIDSSHFTRIFGSDLAAALKDLDILSIEFRIPRVIPELESSCRDVRFDLGEKWYREKFSVLLIENDPCDERSKEKHHWKIEGSDHKHSFGFGNGWFLYTDTDSDPF